MERASASACAVAMPTRKPVKARAHARNDGVEVVELQTGLAHYLEDGGHEPLIMRARIGQNALRNLP